MCSFRETLSSILGILFWAICRDFMCEFEGSSCLVLTLLHRMRPYLIFDIQMLFTIFNICLLEIWFEIFLIWKVLRFRELMTLLKWAFQFCWSSISTPSNLVDTDLCTLHAPISISLAASLSISDFVRLRTMKTVFFALATSPFAAINLNI